MSGIDIPAGCTCIKDSYYKDGLRIYKCPNHQNPVERKLRERFPEGMRDGVDVTIKFMIGFEAFGAYEGWGQGWVVESTDNDGKRKWASARWLDDAVDKYLTKPYVSRIK